MRLRLRLRLHEHTRLMSMSTIVMYIRIFILGIYNAHEEGKRMCCNFWTKRFLNRE